MRRRTGVSLVEYALLAGFVSLVLLAICARVRDYLSKPSSAKVAQTIKTANYVTSKGWQFDKITPYIEEGMIKGITLEISDKKDRFRVTLFNSDQPLEKFNGIPNGLIIFKRRDPECNCESDDVTAYLEVETVLPQSFNK